MICPKCGSRAQVENTYATPAGTARRGVCTGCGAVLSEVSIVAFVDPARGQGAQVLARRLSQGSLRVELKEAASEEAASGGNPTANTTAGR